MKINFHAAICSFSAKTQQKFCLAELRSSSRTEQIAERMVINMLKKILLAVKVVMEMIISLFRNRLFE